jgi:hypothetical protein
LGISFTLRGTSREKLKAEEEESKDFARPAAVKRKAKKKRNIP